MPTADWFVGFYDLELCQNSQWITSARIPLFPYSEGTMQVPDCTIHGQAAVNQDLTSQFLHKNDSMWADDIMCDTTHTTCHHLIATY